MTPESPLEANQPSQPTTAEIPYIYPAHWEADVVLRDGATANLRPVIPTDRDALEKMYAGQSERTIYLRFFTHKPTLSDKELTRFTTVDHSNRVAFVIMLGEEMIGIGRYDRTQDPQEAEVAFMISDAHQGRGIGSILLEHLAAAAQERGIDRFSAEVLPQNRKMLNVFTDAGYEISREFEDGLVMVHFNIDPTDRSRAVREAREHRAEAKSLAELLAPQSLAIFGNPDRWEETGAKVLNTIRQGGYTGTIYPINPVSPSQQQGQEGPTGSYSSVSQLPQTPELAIIALPLAQVAQAVEACGQAGVRGVLIYTSGYADEGASGQARQKALVKLARRYGMRLIGPASFGVLNNSPEVKLDATISPHDPKPGTLGLFSQSSAIGAMFSNSAVKRNLGVSTLLSAGNRADVSGNDMMQYWEDDEATKVCALYLESIGNPRKFSRIARRLSRVKPVLVAKHAVTGQKLPPGHTGRTSLAPTEALDAILNQAGVITAETFDQVLDVAQILVSQPLPEGRNLAIVSNSSALGQIIADKAHTLGLKVTWSETMLRLTDEGANGLEILQEVASSALESPDVDALIGVFLTGESISPQEVALTLGLAGQKAHKPLLAAFPGTPSFESALRGIYQDQQLPQGIPCFESPGASVQALASVVGYVNWRQQENGQSSSLTNCQPKEAAAFIQQLLNDQGKDKSLELSLEASEKLLAFYGIDLLPEYPFSSEEEARSAAELAGGYPVVLKTSDPVLRHRIDLGGVRLGIESAEDLAHEIAHMRRALEPYGSFDYVLQRQVPGGQTAIIRALEDPLMGPVLSFGMAGDATSLLGDWAHRIPPLTERDIHSLVREPKAAAKLFDPAGQPLYQVAALEDLLARLALLKDKHPEIAELELHPVLISEETLTVVGAKVLLAKPQQRTDSSRRTMSR